MVEGYKRKIEEEVRKERKREDVRDKVSWKRKGREKKEKKVVYVYVYGEIGREGRVMKVIDHTHKGRK